MEMSGDAKRVQAATVAEAFPKLKFRNVEEVEIALRNVRAALIEKAPAPGAAPAAGGAGAGGAAAAGGSAERAAAPATTLGRQQAVMAAEALLLCGMRQFGNKSALMNIMCAPSPRRPGSLCFPEPPFCAALVAVLCSNTLPLCVCPSRYACFLLEVQHNTVRGHLFLDRARSMKLSMRERFMLFAKDRERTQRAQGDSVGSGAMDLVSCAQPAAATRQRHSPLLTRCALLLVVLTACPLSADVEFQSSFASLLKCVTHAPVTTTSLVPAARRARPSPLTPARRFRRYHRAALRANRSFWRLLVNPSISFHALSLAFKQMDDTEAQARGVRNRCSTLSLLPIRCASSRFRLLLTLA